ncbi:MAG TPA: phage holin family protein [Usitatibacter sp.]|nr:phage holin family protein [Usitatibacter sp.]
MLRLLAHWLINALALLAVAYLDPGVQVASLGAALVAALVLGFVNMLVRPLVVILTLPVTILTLGLFLFVINALLFWLVAEVVHGFTVAGFGAALLGSILYSVITLIAGWLLFPRSK